MAELPQSEVIYIVILGSLAMLLVIGGLAVFIMTYQKKMLQEQEKRRIMDRNYQHKMIQNQIDSQEMERKRIASDLHDSIGSLLWAAKLNMGFLGRSIEMKGELKNSYDEMMKILDQSIDSVKRISWELTPESFHHTGLSSSIKEMCSRLDGKGLSLLFQEIGTSNFWKDYRALMVFRIVQELVNNAVKHSKAKTVKVELQWKHPNLLVEVSDDGIGFKLNDKMVNGLGWWNITHRSQKIGATLKVNENVEKGSAVELIVPL